ncbi:MAG: hypothetical protein P8184_20720 [Calditrichia bacterium]
MMEKANFYEYELPGGWKVLAGKTDEDNDRLSIKIAGANDWWFHVRGMPGSHVILRAEDDRGAKYVTKSRGAKPGTVQIRKEIVLKVKPGLPQA